MDNLIDQYDYLDFQGTGDHELMAVDSLETFSEQSLESMNFLNRVDYSLNSPLILDELQEFTHYFNGHDYEKRWSPRLWGLRKKAFGGVKHLIDPSDFHTWFSKFNRQKDVNQEDIQRLLADTEMDANITYNVVSAFLKGWLGKNFINPKKARIPIPIRRWGALFLDLHVITLIMNASTLGELRNLNKSIKTITVPASLKEGITYNSKIFGTVSICLGFVLFHSHKRILDRTSILMMKDVYNSRFQSLLSMIHRSDEKFLSNDWEHLNELYKIGDSIIEQAGNDGYKCIKLLEPMCNNKLMKLSHTYRPRVIYYDNFHKHIDSTVEELTSVSPKIIDLYTKVDNTDSVDLLLAFYGSFRHWGHPFVNSLVGVQKLHSRVTKVIKVDSTYPEQLASDLARKVLEDKFKSESKWYVHYDKMDSTHPFHSHVSNNTWPTPKQIRDFGDCWHKLPLMKCFEIPDLIDPSNIYSDKSHSMNRSEVIKYVESGKSGPIPTRRVLDTMINNPETNWKAFLERVNDRGLELEELIIGLKEKERELKEDGRFYSLMSWALREYFVVTEYLIKVHFVPLFKGLTVADDMTTLTKKLLDNASGQGLNDYTRISYANHLDYEKWNNYQRLDSNGPTFRVMGQFLGYPNLIYRTHEFFEKALVYYSQRPDLMKVQGDTLVNRTEHTVVWEGQAGGFEGIRQKGWSILNALSVERESKNLNTKVTLLAQGDNQIICTNYKLQHHRDDIELNNNLERIKLNNDAIMRSIDDGVTKLGLTINKDETMQSADFLNYGKVPIFRGNIRPLEEKRWSRCACVTNDQLPNLGNVLSTVSSNALTIAHYSHSPINTIIHYNFIGNMMRNLIDLHNPALRDSVQLIKNNAIKDARVAYLIKSLYLDPCLGGMSGMSLTRFLIRMFPDPVTESLSFWRVVYLNIQPKFHSLIISLGYCELGSLTTDSFSKLLENPLSLNLKSSVSAISKIKEVIRKSLYERGSDIPNNMIREAIMYSKSQCDAVNMFLISINPLFPRFISEFKNATYLGITESIIGLFENSKTIRNVFKKKMSVDIDKIIVSSEYQSLTSMHSISWKKSSNVIWECSSSHADYLRVESWGRNVIGATIPHPIELLDCSEYRLSSCVGCEDKSIRSGHLITLLPEGLSDYLNHRGNYMAYLGSKTSETTGIIQPWERETKIPLIRRASKLRNVIHWFVEPNSNLALSIFSVLRGLTGEDWDSGTVGFKRTGCGPHRYSCSRQSAGGYSAISPAKLTRMVTTTDTMGLINEDNHDFMYQSLILYSQITIGELHDGIQNSSIYHSHIKCDSCLRTIDNPSLDCPSPFIHPDVSNILEKWKPDGTAWAERRNTITLTLGSWESLTQDSKSYHIGRIQGFIFGDSFLSQSSLVENTALFPLGIASKVTPRSFLSGLLDGLIRVSSLYALSRRSVMELIKPRATLLGIVLYLIEVISLDSSVINMWRHKNFILEFSTQSHKIPASYPLSNFDLGLLGRDYLKLMFKKLCIINDQFYSEHKSLWIFSDVNDIRIVGSLYISGKIAKLLYNKSLKTTDMNKVREYKSALQSFRDPKSLDAIERLSNIKFMARVDQEVRHAAKDMVVDMSHIGASLIDWTEEETSNIHKCRVNYSNQIEYNSSCPIPRIQDPLISGMRLFQCATGSHYKIRSIVLRENILYNDVICGGDGSGGIGSWILRNNSSSRLIFNSLLDISKSVLKGSSPSGPSAIELIPEIAYRCVNVRDAWKNPSDLSVSQTWAYFLHLKQTNNMKIDLIILDMEVKDIDMIGRIIKCLEYYLTKLLESNGTVIFKTYWNDIMNNKMNILNTIGVYFKTVELIWTDFSSSHTSEIYVIMRSLTDKNLFLKPSVDSFQSFMLSSPVFSTSEKEFRRAISLKALSPMKGVPYRFNQDPFVSLSTLLMTLGVPSGVAGLLGEMVKYPASLTNPKDQAYIIYLVSINSLLKLTQGNKELPSIVSDSTVWNVGVLTLGFFFWLSVTEEQFELYDWSQSVIKYYFPFSWTNYTHHKLNYIKYSLRCKYSNTKNFHFDKELARIGQVIRIYSLLFRYPRGEMRENEVNKVLHEYDSHLSLKSFSTQIDILKLLQGPLYFQCERSLPSSSISSTVLDSMAFTN